MRAARRERKSAQRRKDSYEVKFAKCAGECKLQVTNVLTNPIAPEIKAPAANPNALAKPNDANAASTALRNRITRWAAPVSLDPQCKAGCDCTEIEDVDWTRKKTHTRKFRDTFQSGSNQFTAEVDIDFKVAIVIGACLESPNQPI
jgi:hypothetical protein